MNDELYDVSKRMRDVLSTLRILENQVVNVLELTDPQPMKRKIEQVVGETEATSPLCEVHQVPMKWMSTSRGNFWSCHVKDEAGNFCTYRPLKSAGQ